MSQAKAFGSISIIDITDLGEFSVQPMSNMPLNVIYNPDERTFIPTWGQNGNNLVLTPSLYYAGQEKLPSSSDIDITWTKRIGSDAEGSISTNNGETVDGGVLTVSQNQFTEQSSMITYIVSATYTEPVTRQELHAKGQITFGLIKNATRVKNCVITGDSVFKQTYNGVAIGATTITLKATLTGGISVSDWQFAKVIQNGNESTTYWVSYPRQSTTDQLVVNSSAKFSGTVGGRTYTDEPIFENDKCIIKCVTSNSSVYDLHAITIIKDGPPGDSIISAVLTNDSQNIPVTVVNGVEQAIDWNTLNITSRIIIYEGGTDVTQQWTISRTASNSVTLDSTVLQSTSDTVKIVGLTADTGTVTFECTHTQNPNDHAPIIKVFSLAKIRSGADGVTPTIYSVEPDNVAVNKSGTTYSPNSVVFRAYQQTGNNTRIPYEADFKVYPNITYQQYIDADPKPSTNYHDEGEETYSVDLATMAGNIGAPISSLLCVLFAPGSSTDILDAQSVVVTSDGAKGETGNTGAAGESAVNVVLGNYNDVLNCDSNNSLLSQAIIEIPFTAFYGLTQVGCTINLSDRPRLFNLAPSSFSAATSSSPGYIRWTIPAGTAINQPTGGIALIFKVTVGSTTKSIRIDFTWVRHTAPTDGQNAVILQIFTPNGTNVFNQSVESITMAAQLMDGATNQTESDGVRWSWAKWGKNNQDTWGYIPIENDQLKPYEQEVSKDTVDSYASYRCTATYNSTDYTAYFSLFDKTDPIQVSVFSSFGEQIINGQGVGVLYVRVTQLGQEVDQLLSDRFIDGDAPTGATVGDHYYQLNPSDWTATLMEFTASDGWQPYSTVHSGQDDPPPYKGTYSWVWRDKDGNEIPRNGNNQQITVNGVAKSLPREGKVVYIDGTMINTKIIADVEVTI